MAIAETILSLAETIEASKPALAIGESSWMFPLLETAHVVAISLVIGCIAVVDLRLLNLAWCRRSVRQLSADILPYTWVGFGFAVVTGALMFISRATTYVENLPFLIKMCVLALAGANMLAFHFLTYRSVDRWDSDCLTPMNVRVAGGLSLLLWVTVVFLGRWIAFVD